MIRAIPVPVLLWMLAGALPGQAQVDSKLEERLRTSAPGERIPFYVVLEERVDRGALERNFPAERYSRAERRALLVQRAKEVARRTQAPLLEFLGSRPASEVERVRPLWILNAVAAEATPAVVAELLSLPGIDHATLRVRSRAITAPPPARAPRSGPEPELAWGVERIRAPEVWATGVTGAGVRVAHFDTGACYDHPDLVAGTWINAGEIPDNQIDDDQNGYVDDYRGWDFGSGDNDPMDDQGHGTHTMGSLVGDGTLGLRTGVAPGVEVMICKVLVEANGDGTEVWEAYQYSLENGADMVTASLGWITGVHAKNRADWREATNNAAFAGLILVYSSGNERTWMPVPESVRTPGDVPAVITVGSTDRNDNVSPFSSPGPTEWGADWLGEDTDGPYRDWEWNAGGLQKPDVSAPGSGVDSTVPCDDYASGSGTSMATPHVAGVIAMMLEVNPYLTREDILDVFAATSLDLGEAGRDSDFGLGRVDALAAVQAAAAPAPVEAFFYVDRTLVDARDVVRFSGAVQNTTGSSQARDLWVDVTMPDGTLVVGGLYGPKHVTLAPGAELTFMRDYRAPVSVSGTLIATLKCGTFGGEVEDLAAVEVTVR